ncbi:MAG: tetratricopeptide repeat protein [Treponema sp.]|jgi:tetratricopeptide (TPR) repeat protein|nr:tetratricopeptide repeat protein [Treponema sp.]
MKSRVKTINAGQRLRRLALALLFITGLPLFAQTGAQPGEGRANIPDALQNYRIGRDLEGRNRMGEANIYYAEAVRICTDEISRNNTGMDSYTVLTWALLRQKRYAEVIRWGEQALQYANDYRIIETLGEAYFYMNDYAHSLSLIQRYVHALPRGDRASTAYFFMGEIYRNQRKYLLADAAYTTAVTLESRMPLWWYRLASARESAGEYASAMEAYEKALSLNSGYKEASEGLERVRRLNAINERNAASQGGGT